ncbi:MAG TPA: helix-hairpin-helix domain-containing protein [Abditibacterium sp.]|jgi:hypothetical protein
MAQKGLTKDGRLIDAGQPGAAFQVDTEEAGTDTFIESVRQRYATEQREQGAAHLAVEGKAVPILPTDEESPEEKLRRMEAEGTIAERGSVATTQGVKTAAELGTSGLGVNDPETPSTTGTSDTGEKTANDQSANDDQGTGEKSGESAQGQDATLSPEQQSIVEALGEKTAQILFAEGLNSVEDLRGKTKNDLVGFAGIGPAGADKILEFAKSGE